MADIADDMLPVFPFRINWREGISERLDWKTNVMADILGNEQRQGARLTPRREFEVTLSVWDQERAFLDLWLHRIHGEFLLPLWHDSTRIAQEAAQGASEVWGDFRGLEWEIGSYGLLRGVSALVSERVQIAEVHDDRLVLETPLISNWPKGSRIEPLRRGRLSEQTRARILTERVSEITALFELTREQPYDEGFDSWDQYLGLPVLTKQPNRSEQIDLEYLWTYSESDSDTGRRYRKADNNRAITEQKHAWLLRGRTAKREFRSMLYRLRGAQGGFWLPTFSTDLELTRPIGLTATSFYVKRVGYGYTGGAVSGRNRVCIQLRNGTRLYRRITGTANSGTDHEERLVVDLQFPAAIAMADVTRISFMDTVRFQNDRVEFNHVNAADGASTVSAILRAYRDERVPPTVFAAPIPTVPMSNFPCGDAPDEDPCAPPGTCIPKTFFTWSLAFNGCKEFYCPTRNWYQPPITSHPPNWQYRASLPILQGDGRDLEWFEHPGRWPGASFAPIGIVNNCSDPAGTTYYESNAYNTPGSVGYQDPAYANLRGQPIMTTTTTNGNFTITFLQNLVDGPGALQIQYGAFWCGDFVAQGTLDRTLLIDCKPVGSTLIESGLVGNVPYTWSWS